VAKRKTVTKPARTPVAPPPIMERLQNSGMMRFGEGQPQVPSVGAARMQKPTGRKPAGKKGRRK